MHSQFATPLEQPMQTMTGRRRFVIGLPASRSATERRFPLTPEGAGMLIDRGYAVIMESGASGHIHYNDSAYSKRGVTVGSRSDALAADIVISLAPLEPADTRYMRRGAMLLTMICDSRLNTAMVESWLQRGIVCVSIDRIEDSAGNHPFADILAEIDGRAAIATASSLLADPVAGKGILLGGVAGIVPCEVTVLGSGISAIAASRSAVGLGAMVRMFDNDIYSLRAAVRDLGPQIIGSSCHEKVLLTALSTADVVIVTGGVNASMVLGAEVASTLKRGVLIFDLTDRPGTLFASLPTVNLATVIDSRTERPSTRAVYVNAGSAVPRTAAMALSNTFGTLLGDVMMCEGITNALKLTPGLRRGVITFLGKLTDRKVASQLRIRAVDINIILPLL